MSLTTKKYAMDLLELSKQDEKTELYKDTLEKINNALNDDSELSIYFSSSDYTASEKKEKLQEYFNNTLDNDVLTSFFLMNSSTGKKNTETGIVRDFLTYYYQQKGVLFGTVYSIRKLSEQEIQDIEEAIGQQIESKVHLENKLDTELIGGVKVVINNNVWDGSYRSKLKNMRAELLNRDEKLEESAQEMSSSIKEHIDTYERAQVNIKSSDTTGYVTTVADGIANISGVFKAMAGELLKVGDTEAMVMNLEEDNIGAVLLGDSEGVTEGTEVVSTGRVVEVPVGDALLGRVVDATGKAIDGKGSIKASKHMPIESPAPGVIDRQAVNEPLETGIKLIDSMIPIGKGQRELIIGDRQTGKTSIAVDTILNQQGKNVKCIYVAVGQKNSTVAQIVEKLRQNGALAYTTIVVAGASESAALQYIAPYTGATIGEFWMNRGEDVLIVYDDLSKHAVAYRTLSLLLRRPPGREAYPGDVFYLHSRLLERSGKLSEALGSGSMTALPIVETQAGDISAYIPTNVISITDGQIFLQTDMFNSGQRPAIDSGLSVSRVGSAAQTKAMKKVSSSLKLDLAQYQEVLDFAQFGSDVDAATKKTINHGQHLMALLKQPQYSPMDMEDQVIILFASQKGYVDNIPVEKVNDYEKKLILELHSAHPTVVDMISSQKVLTDEISRQLDEVIDKFTQRYKMTVK